MKLRQIMGDFIRKRNPLDIEYIQVPIEHTPSEFTRLRIAHVSDVHIPRLAFSPREMADHLKKQSPDVIFLTGDMMDSKRDFDGVMIALMVDLLIKIAPVYAISGNHERKNRAYYKIWRTMLELRGVHFINNKMTCIEKEGMIFVITGMRDIHVSKMLDVDLSFLNEREIVAGKCHLLLHHKPHIWRSYYPPDVPLPDVVFSGHAHGGQIRLPFIKRGVIAPDQGFFPKYISGLYHYSDGSKEVVSRGLASSTNPVRINNPPHLPIVELVPKDNFS